MNGIGGMTNLDGKYLSVTGGSSGTLISCLTAEGVLLFKEITSVNSRPSPP